MPMQVSIVAFKKGQLRVLSHAWDRNLGGRDLDNVLFEYFANEFQEKYKLDVRTNLRASFRLRMACEKVRRRSDCTIGLAAERSAPATTWKLSC
jgi:heat shock protein 4